MSKYLNSGPSRYLKSQRENTSAQSPMSKPVIEESTRNTEGYTDQDLHLFNQLTQKAQAITTRSAPANSRQSSNYRQTYTQKDIAIFDKLTPGQKDSPASSSRHDTNSALSRTIKVMEFTD